MVLETKVSPEPTTDENALSSQPRLEIPQFTHADLLAVTGWERTPVQQALTRDLIPLMGGVHKSGRVRLFSALDCVQFALVRELQKHGVPISRAGIASGKIVQQLATHLRLDLEMWIVINAAEEMTEEDVHIVYDDADFQRARSRSMSVILMDGTGVIVPVLEKLAAIAGYPTKRGTEVDEPTASNPPAAKETRQTLEARVNALQAMVEEATERTAHVLANLTETVQRHERDIAKLAGYRKDATDAH